MRPCAFGRIGVVRNQGQRVGCRRNVAPAQRRRNVGPVTRAFLRNLAAIRERGYFQGRRHSTTSLSFSSSRKLNLGPRQFGLRTPAALRSPLCAYAASAGWPTASRIIVGLASLLKSV